MAAKVEEAYSERTEKVNASGEIVEIEIHYLVFDAADEDAALAAARTKAKSKTVTGMAFESVEVEERVNSTTWRVKAEYASTGSSGGDEGGDGEDTFSTSFDTGGGTMHLNQSLGTSAKAPNDAPDFGGAIGVDGEGNVDSSDERAYDGNDAAQLLGLVDRLAARSRALAADVENRGALTNGVLCGVDDRVEVGRKLALATVGKASAVGKAIRGRVEDRHNRRAFATQDAGLQSPWS